MLHNIIFYYYLSLLIGVILGYIALYLYYVILIKRYSSIKSIYIILLVLFGIICISISTYNKYGNLVKSVFNKIVNVLNYYVNYRDGEIRDSVRNISSIKLLIIVIILCIILLMLIFFSGKNKYLNMLIKLFAILLFMIPSIFIPLYVFLF